MNEIAILPEKDEEAIVALEWIRGFRVSNNEDYTKLDQLCVKAKQHEEKGEDLYRKAIEDAYKTHKGLLAKLKDYVFPAVEFRRIAKSKMFSWKEEQERLRLEEERKQQEAARKLAEDQAIKDAGEAEKAGDKAGAEAIIQAPVFIPPVIVPKSVPKSVTVLREVWSFEVIDASLVPAEFKIVDTVKLGGIVRATKGTMKIPGINIFKKSV